MSNRFPYRFAQLHTCLRCERTFHPWYGSARKFCSNKCAGQAKHDAAMARWRANHGPVSPQQVSAFLAEARDALARYESQLAATEFHATGAGGPESST